MTIYLLAATITHTKIMNQYLTEQEHAAKTLINSIYKEEHEFAEMKEKAESMKKHYEVLHWDFITAESSEDFSDMQIQNKFIKMAQMRENLTKAKHEIDEFEKSILEKEKSITTLSMSLLQIAKQGISTIHRDLNSCPNGKSLESETLKNVIWQARNQGIHSEEGKPHKPVIDCFANLANDYGAEFDITVDLKNNKSKRIIDLLGWNNYENYKADMLSLLG